MVRVLNQQTSNKDGKGYFTPDDILLFSESAYQKNPKIESDNWNQLLVSSEKSIEHIIVSAAKNKNKPFSHRVRVSQ